MNEKMNGLTKTNKYKLFYNCNAIVQKIVFTKTVLCI